MKTLAVHALFCRLRQIRFFGTFYSSRLLKFEIDLEIGIEI